MKDQISIIPATPEHFEAVTHLFNSPEELYLVYPLATYPLDLEQMRALVEKRSDLTVCLDGTEVIGFANLYDVKPGSSAFIGNVVLSQKLRGKGLGKWLMQHMMDICIKKYQSTPRLSVFSFNTAALLLYHNLGFIPFAMESRKYIDGSQVALIHMEQQFTESVTSSN